MKPFILSISLLILSKTVAAQTPLYHPDYGQMQSMVDKKNAQYENGLQTVQTAYQRLINLKLINRENIKLLAPYQENVKKEAPKWSKVDFSIPGNVDVALEFINRYFTKNRTIKDEMDLLDKIFLELQMMRNTNPAKWTESTRYSELMGILKDLERCDPSEIGNIGWKHGLL